MTKADWAANEAAGAPPSTIMVVDESRVQRRILSSQLARAGYSVIEAGSAEEALDLFPGSNPDMVISDWVMAGMSGLEFCGRVRGMKRANYTYFILLTSKSDATEIAKGLDGGADDFLTKPVSGEEMRARIAAGQRILRMERELTEKNRLLSSTLTELQRLYATIERDLEEARLLQQGLMRERFRSFGSVDVSLMFAPSGHVGGDIVGFFPIGDRRVGVYGLDVSGHGITSALLAANLVGFLTGDTPEVNIALERLPDGSMTAIAPDRLAANLNRILLEELVTDSYCTLAFADIDLRTGEVHLVQAGHPYPMVLRRDGTTEVLGAGGAPIGLFADATYETITCQLGAGDRLLLMSDGVTEACDALGQPLDDDGLANMLTGCASLKGPAFLASFEKDLALYAGGKFQDDVSGVMAEFHGTCLNLSHGLVPRK